MKSRGSLLLVLVALLGCSPKISSNKVQTEMRPTSPILPLSTGTFTQPWTVDAYTPVNWDQEFAAMQESGIDLWIYQWVGDSKNKTTIYPTQLPGYGWSAQADQVEIALSKAKKYGMKVFLGLVFNDEWWSKEGSDLDWLLHEAREMNALADELYQNYYARYPETFAGWYINWEMDNYAGYNRKARQRENIITALQQVSGHLETLNPELPSSIAPFFNTAGGSSAEKYGQFWYEVLSQTNVDILMLQDGIGVNHANLEQIPEWYREVCTGVRRAGNACWSDLENFSMDEEGNFSSAPTERVIQQHRIAAQYVDRIVTFSFLSYMSPVEPTHLKFFQNYKAFVDRVKHQE